MQREYWYTLYAYHSWANDLILTRAGQVSEAQLFARTQFPSGSLHGTLVHTLSAEWVWRLRCQEGISPPSHLRNEDFPTVESMRVRWSEEEQKLREFVAALDGADLERVVHYTNQRGVPYATPLWQILLQVVNHGTQHRAEAAAMLTDYGCSPGDMDLILFVRLQQARAEGG